MAANISPVRPSTRPWLSRNRSVLSLPTILLAWELTARLFGTSETTGAIILPGVGSTLSAFVAFANYWVGGLGAGDTRMGFEETYWGATLGLMFNLGITLLRLIAGLALGLVLGVGLGFLTSWSLFLRDLLAFPAHLLR